MSAAAAERFVSAPMFVDAIVWDGSVEAATVIIDWVLDLSQYGTARYHEADQYSEQPRIMIDTKTGSAFAEPGDAVIFNEVNGEFYPCPAEVFAVKYRRANTII